jgi:hypothetical protein
MVGMHCTAIYALAANVCFGAIEFTALTPSELAKQTPNHRRLIS